MIDLHCHLLPGIDDGARDLDIALAMARMAVDDGIGTIACTPHILPGVYNNTRATIEGAVERLAAEIERAGIPLQVTSGADVHIAPDLLADLKNGTVPTIGESRYFLFEPPDQIVPPRMNEFAFQLIASGFVPILTHPERLVWIEKQYSLVQQLVAGGVLVQVTAGSFVGGFGRRAKYWAERMLDEGMIDLVATDAHNLDRRPPLLTPARGIISERAGDETATQLVATNPLHILENVLLSRLQHRDRQGTPVADTGG